MKLRDVVVGARGEYGAIARSEIIGDEATEVSSIACDSRSLAPGAMFCCVRGAEHDGHDFAHDAVVAGASALVVDHRLDEPIAQVVVPSVADVAGPLAASFHGHPSRAMAVLGVTGTNGKTTTTYFLDSIGNAAGHKTGIIGTVGARFGGVAAAAAHTTPDACSLQALLAVMRRSGVETVAMEVSSHALDQHRVDGTSMRAVCFTNLSQDHLDYHGSVESYRAAKAALFSPSYSTVCAINIDDEFGPELCARSLRSGLDVWTYSTLEDADVSLGSVELGRRSTRFVLVGSRVGRPYEVSIPLVGAFNVSNALAAATTALAAGLPIDAVVTGLEHVDVVPGRLERIDNNRDFDVFVDYAHTPGAITAVLDAVRPLTSADGRVIVVFGCGGDRDHSKRPLMGRAASSTADLLFVTADNSRSEDPAAIAAEVLTGINRGDLATVVVELDRGAAIRRALREARAGDVVVIAGKGHETGQTAGGVTVPFDDRAVALAALQEMP